MECRRHLECQTVKKVLAFKSRMWLEPRFISFVLFFLALVKLNMDYFYLEPNLADEFPAVAL